MIRDNRPSAVVSKPSYLLAGQLDTSTEGKIVTNTLAKQPTKSPILEQFTNIESVGITPKDKSMNSFLLTSKTVLNI